LTGVKVRRVADETQAQNTTTRSPLSNKLQRDQLRQLSAMKARLQKFNESISDRNTAEAWSFHRGWYASSFRQAGRIVEGATPKLIRDIVAVGPSTLQSVAYVTAWSPFQACKQRRHEESRTNDRVSFPRGNAVKSSMK
jgi:hypothetical protein